MPSFIGVKLGVPHLMKQGDFRKFSFGISKLMKEPSFCCGQRIELSDHPLYGDIWYVKRKCFKCLSRDHP